MFQPKRRTGWFLILSMKVQANFAVQSSLWHQNQWLLVQITSGFNNLTKHVQQKQILLEQQRNLFIISAKINLEQWKIV